MGSNALFSDQDIQEAGGTPSQAQSSQPLGDSLFSDDELTTAAPGAIQRAASGFYDTTVKPVVQGAENLYNGGMSAGHEAGTRLQNGDYLGAAGAILKGFGHDTPNSYNLISDLLAAHVQQLKTSVELAKSGRYTESAGHALAGVTPIVGPVAAHAGERIGSGDIAGGLGEGAGLLATIEAPRAIRGAGKVANAVRSVASEDVAAAKAQPIVQEAVRGAAEDTAATEGVTPKAAASVRDAIQNTGDSVLERSRGAYDKLDEASGGRWQRFDDQIKNLRDKAADEAGINEDKFDEYSQRANDLEQSQTELIDRLVKEGKIDADLAESAKSDYKQAHALYDVSQQIRSSASGLRPEIGSSTGTPEAVDPGKLAPRLNKLYDSGRLQQALGEDGAQSLMKQVDDALKIKTSAIRTAKLIKTVTKYGASAVGLGLVGHGAIAALGGNH